MSAASTTARGFRGRHLLGAGLVVTLLAATALVVTDRAGGTETALSSAAASAFVEIHAVHGASFVPALEGRRPLFILALGSDARPGQDILHERADSIHLIGINLARHRATALGFPRDSWVPIPGFGTNKINTAMADGGPPLLVRTVENLTGVTIDFWLLTSFNGLITMVSQIGGLTVNVPQAMHDHYSGSNFAKGIRHLTGRQALSFARDRHSFLNGDLTRSLNQGRLLVAALSSLHARFAKDPAALFDWVAVLWKEVHTDLDLSTILDLALTATQVPVSNVNNLIVPATVGNVGAVSVVFILSSASAVYADIRANGIVGS